MSEQTKVVNPIGRVEKSPEGKIVALEEPYRRGLAGLEGFSHCIVVWWGHAHEEHRDTVPMELELPYAPGIRAGIFATRSQIRPNPVNCTVVRIVGVDTDRGILRPDELDAFADTPVLDIKPYYGCLDRVRDYRQPDWVPGEWGTWYVPIPEQTW